VIGNRVISQFRPLTFSVINNPNILPADVSGLLGLNFLFQIINTDEVICFDFKKSLLSIGPRYSIASPLKKDKFSKAKIRNLPNGLLVSDVYINTNAKSLNGSVRPSIDSCAAMIDLGSTYSIINNFAVTMLEKKYGGASFTRLILTNKYLAGIDGNPLQVTLIIFRKFIYSFNLSIS
jgi:hypothetical protein